MALKVRDNIQRKDFPNLQVFHRSPTGVAFVGVPEQISFQGNELALPSVEISIIDPFGNAIAADKPVFLSLGQSYPDGCAKLESRNVVGKSIEGIAFFEDVRGSGDNGCKSTLQASFAGQLDVPAGLAITFTSTTKPNDGSTQNVVIVASAIASAFFLVSASALVFCQRQRPRHSISQTYVKSSSSSHPQKVPRLEKSSHEITVGATTTVSGMTNFMIAIPGYLTLNQNDYMIFEDKVLGSGATASIYLGVLSTAHAKTLSFSQIAVKVFKGDFTAASIKYELALLSSLQYRSKPENGKAHVQQRNGSRNAD